MSLVAYRIVQVGHYLYPGWSDGQKWVLYYESIIGCF